MNPPPTKIESVADLANLQRALAGALFRPLTESDGMQRANAQTAAAIITPNDRLTAFERLEIYNRQYWFRLLDCLYDDFPGLRAVLGGRNSTGSARNTSPNIPRNPLPCAISAHDCRNSSTTNPAGLRPARSWRGTWWPSSGRKSSPSTARR
ncbi:MAG: putative DNA-binding domain-containing protein [Chthoniobacteraceae bacterium]